MLTIQTVQPCQRLFINIFNKNSAFIGRLALGEFYKSMLDSSKFNSTKEARVLREEINNMKLEKEAEEQRKVDLASVYETFKYGLNKLGINELYVKIAVDKYQSLQKSKPHYSTDQIIEIVLLQAAVFNLVYDIVLVDEAIILTQRYARQSVDDEDDSEFDTDLNEGSVEDPEPADEQKEKHIGSLLNLHSGKLLTMMIAIIIVAIFNCLLRV